MKITRADITDIIYNRLNKTVSKRNIYSVLKIICHSMVEDFVSGHTVNIKNFGSFVPYVFPGHNGFNVQTKKMQYVPAKKSVKLCIDPKFHKRLIAWRKAELEAESTIK